MVDQSPPVGLQFIIYRNRVQEDLPGVLREAAAAGYAGVEAGNLFAIKSESEVKDLLAANGLVVCGLHSGYDDFTDESKLDSHLAYLEAVGARHLMCSGVGARDSLADYDRAAALFNRVGQRCRQAGVDFCYHNHAWEFEDLGGQKGIHRLAEATDPDLVKFNIDVYWVDVGGEDPAAFVRRYADRAGYFHFKDGEPGVFTELGRGRVDLAASLDAALEVGAEWIVYEQDQTQIEPAESIAVSRQHLRALGV
ncbi:MAG: TIM barrel protein [Candidatus Latescibacteria bacterium]|nr:TIM barrel protein [Candidatus Latescibacterota bacterium]